MEHWPSGQQGRGVGRDQRWSRNCGLRYGARFDDGSSRAKRKNSRRKFGNSWGARLRMGLKRGGDRRRKFLIQLEHGVLRERGRPFPSSTPPCACESLEG